MRDGSAGSAASPHRGRQPPGDAVADQIEGRRPVREALRAGRAIRKVLVADVARSGVPPLPLREIVRLAQTRHVPVQHVDARWLDGISRTGRHQGVIALAAVVASVDIEAILGRARGRGEPALVVLLDGIEDPQNTGAIIRVAEAAGCHGLILTTHRSSGLTPAVARASAGAVEHLPVARVTNLARTIDALRAGGLWVLGADLEGNNLFETALEPPLAVVIGGEGRGLSRLVRERCDMRVRIPMFGRIASLNAASAAAVVLYEIRRQQAVRGRPEAPVTPPGLRPGDGARRG